MAAAYSSASTPALPARDGARASREEDRLKLLHRSLCREIALQSGRAQRAALEVLDVQLDALRREMARLDAGQQRQGRQLAGLSSAAGWGGAQSCIRSREEASTPNAPYEASLESWDSTSKGAEAHRTEVSFGESTCPGLDDESSGDCDDPSDHGSCECQLGERPLDCALAAEKSGELFGPWARSELQELKYGSGFAEFEVRLSKMDAAQQLSAEAMDAKLTGELERIASEHRYGRTLIADVVSELLEESAAKIGDVLKERQENSAVVLREALNALESKLRSEVVAAQEECRASQKASVDNLGSQLRSEIAAVRSDQQVFRSELQLARDVIQSSQVQALESLDAKMSADLEDVQVQLETAQNCLLQLEVAQKDLLESHLRLDDFAVEKDHAVSRGRRVVDEALLDERLGEFSEHLGSFSVQLCEVEAKAVEGFPRRCAEHRESHFKALESLLRAELDTKVGRLEAAQQAALEALGRQLREDLRGSEVDQRVGDAKIWEEIRRRAGPDSLKVVSPGARQELRAERHAAGG